MARSEAQIRAVGDPAKVGDAGRSGYSDAFKADAVAKARAAQSVAQAARGLGIARNTLISWMRDADAVAVPSLVAAVRSGNRRAYLETMRDELAKAIDAGMTPRDRLPSMRMLDGYMRELDEMDALDREEALDAADVPDEVLDLDDL
jgi:transposase-like protein